MTPTNAPKFRIKVDDGVFVFPLSAKGKTVYATGTIETWPQKDASAQGYQLKASAVSIEHESIFYRMHRAKSRQ